MKFFKKLFSRMGRKCRHKKDCGIKNEKPTSRRPLVSVVVTSYNYAAYIGQTLDSIAAQTYPNFEVIVVDDGSTDDSIAVIERYLADKRFRLYTHPGGVNKGLCDTMKLGIEKAQGEYIAFCESDDLWKPQYLEKKVAIINTYRDVGFILNKIEAFGDEEVIRKRTRYLNAVNASFAVGGNKVDISRKKYVNFIPTFSAVMIRKDILASLDYHSPIVAWMDFWLYRQILQKHLLFYTDEKLTLWRMHDSLNGLNGAEEHTRKSELFIALSDRLLGIEPSAAVKRQLQQIRNSIYWDEAYYKAHYGHLLEGVEPVEHYYYWGWKLGCNPSASFSNDAYLSFYMHLHAHKYNPLLHYEKIGKKKKRRIFAVGECLDTPITEEDIQRISEQKGKHVLFISHELTLTGAPRALLNMVLAAKQAGIHPVLVSLAAGPMENEVRELGIPLFILPFMQTRLQFGNKPLNRFLATFDQIVFNTLVTVPLVKQMPRVRAQKLCWLHEGSVSFRLYSSCYNLSELFPLFDQVYAVGAYAASFAAPYLPADRPVKQLLYGIPDEAVGAVKGATVAGEVDTRKVNLLFPGSITRRKGHRVFLKSLKYLPRDVRNQLVIYLAGAPAKRRIARQIEHCPCSCIRYLGELKHDDLLKLYPWMDGVLCPSLDDPMPIVCTEAMMFSKPVVVTEHTGTAALVEDGVSGYVIPAGSPRKLAKALEQVCAQKDRLPGMGRQARRIYEADFTMEIFQKEVEQTLG